MLSRYIHTLLIAVSLLVGCGAPNSAPTVEAVSEVVGEQAATLYGVRLDGFELRKKRLQHSETLSSIMRDYGRTAAEANRIDAASKSRFSLRRMRVGNEYTLFLTRDSSGRRRVDYIAYECDPLNYVLFVMCGDTIDVRLGEKPSTIVRQRRQVVVESSLLGSIRDSGLPYELGAELERIFQWRVDLFSLRRGDIFSVIYEQRFVEDSVAIGLGRICGAKFESDNYQCYAIPFSQGGEEEFWNREGRNLRMQLLKSPLRYSKINPHSLESDRRDSRGIDGSTLGVDYAAPTGTPVYAVADGEVAYCGFSESEGERITIRHKNNLESAYCHLSRYARNTKRGAKVAQGDLIGYVGSTGDVDVPQLRYRLWRDGVEIDPFTLPDMEFDPIEASERAAFERVRDRVVAELDSAI